MNHPILKPTHIPPPRGWGKIGSVWHYYHRSMLSLCSANAYTGPLQEQPDEGDYRLCSVCRRKFAALIPPPDDHAHGDA